MVQLSFSFFLFFVRPLLYFWNFVSKYSWPIEYDLWWVVGLKFRKSCWCNEWKVPVGSLGNMLVTCPLSVSAATCQRLQMLKENESSHQFYTELHSGLQSYRAWRLLGAGWDFPRESGIGFPTKSLLFKHNMKWISWVLQHFTRTFPWLERNRVFPCQIFRWQKRSLNVI